MSQRMQRITAIVRVDVLTRFRRGSTVVVFLLLSACAYFWIPPVSTGRTIMEIAGHRAIYNSAAIGMATAILATIFIGLFGFYVISNAIQRDVRSRCGFVLASTTMRSSEYLFGKFLGNVLFLTTFVGGYMLVSMAMLVIRGEAPLEPLVFVKQYALLVPPAITFVSALAVIFESIPWLSGKFGDVVYFFFWVTSLGVVASAMEKGGPAVTWPRYFDFTSFGFAMQTMRRVVHTDAVTIGSATFDPRKGTVVFPGLSLDPSWIAPRIVATLLPVVLLAVGLLFFHRFDPARVRGAAEKAKRGWIARLHALFKPFTRALYALAARGGTSLFAAARVDAFATLTSYPLALAAMAVLSIATIATSNASFRSGVLPIAFGALALLLSDVASRDARAGTTALVYAAPRLKSQFVLWKLMTTSLLGVMFLAVPIVRVAVRTPSSLVALLTGIVFIAATATSLGVASSNPKTFIVAFLSFWYIVVNDKGTTPFLDFAGWSGLATPLVMATYAAVAIAFCAVAEMRHRAKIAE